MIEVGKRYWIDHGNLVRKHQVLGVTRIAGKVSQCRVKFIGSDHDLWVSHTKVFETEASLLNHLKEKAEGYAYYAAECAKRIGDAELDELEAAEGKEAA